MKANPIKPLKITNFPKQRPKLLSFHIEETTNHSTNDKTTRRKVSIQLEPTKKPSTSTYLDEIYLKYSANLEKYFESNRNDMKLTGNRYFDRFPQFFLFKQRREQMEEMVSKLKEANMSHVLGDDFNLKKNIFLTPLPNKSRQLIGSDKELKDFQLAERVAVVMRVYEYTRGLRSKVGIEEYHQLMSDDKEMTLYYLRSIVNGIGNWWKRMKDRKGKQKTIEMIKQERLERINDQLQEHQYRKYHQMANEIKICKGLSIVSTIVKRHMSPNWKNFIKRLKSMTVRSEYYKNPLVRYKAVQRNIDAWLSQLKVCNKLEHRFSVIHSKQYYSTVANDWMFLTCKRQCASLWTLVSLQRKIIAFLHSKNKSDSRQAIIKPLPPLDYLFKHRDLAIIDKLNCSIQLIMQLRQKSKVNFFFRKWSFIPKKAKPLVWKVSNYQLLATKMLIVSMITLTETHHRYVFYKLIQRKRLISYLSNFTLLLELLIKKRAYSFIQHKAISNALLNVLRIIESKAALYNRFLQWKAKNTLYTAFTSLVHHHTMKKIKQTFLRSLSQVNKRKVTQYTKRHKGDNAPSSTFKYYCFTNSSKKEYDTIRLRLLYAHKLLSFLFIKLFYIKASFHCIKHFKRPRGCKALHDPWEIIKLNAKLSNHRIQFKLAIERLDMIISKRVKNKAFHRIILNHLIISSLNINAKGIMSLLKEGQRNTYQTVLNRIFDLNMTDNEWEEGKMNFSLNVKKIISVSSPK